jgi:hypothetical protein
MGSTGRNDLQMTYLQRFSAHAPELAKAIDLVEDAEFKRELDTDEVTSSAFAVCDAFSEFWSAWHGGQSSRLYALGSSFSSTFDYSHRASEVEEPGPVRDFYACLCVAFDVDDPVRWEVFGHPTRASKT